MAAPQSAIADLWCASCGAAAETIINIVGAPTPLCLGCLPPDDHIQTVGAKEDIMTTEANETINETTIDTSESQDTPEPAETAPPEEQAPQTRTRRKRSESQSSGNGNGHSAATEQEAAVSVAEAVEGQFETVRTNALQALSTLRAQRGKLDEHISSLENIVERYVRDTTPAPEPTARVAAPGIRKAARKAAAKSSGRAPKRTKAQLAESIEQIVKYLKKEGATSTEDLRKALKIDKPVWLTTAKHLKKDKRVKTTGQKRSTKWLIRG